MRPVHRGEILTSLRSRSLVEQDQNDESALELQKRIAEERVQLKTKQQNEPLAAERVSHLLMGRATMASATHPLDYRKPAGIVETGNW